MIITGAEDLVKRMEEDMRQKLSHRLKHSLKS